MSNAPLNPPAETLASLVRFLAHAVVTRGLWWNLPQAIVNLVVNRTREMKFRFARLAARLEAGTFRPRRTAQRRKPIAPKSGRNIPVRRKFGWLRPLVPEAVTAANWLELLLAEPEMVAMMAAAPAEMGRIFRPFCWMLRVKPPPIIASPRRKPPLQTTPQTTPEIPPKAGPAPEAAPSPSLPRPPPRHRPPKRREPRACGPPCPA